MSKWKTWDEVPEKVREDLADGIDEESLTDSIKSVLLRTANAEKASIEKKKEAKEVKQESQENLTEIEKLQKQIDELTKSQKSSKFESFLEGKEITDEEKEKFLELAEKGVDPETAYQSAAKESIQAAQNQENMENNDVGWKGINISGDTVTMEQLAEMEQDQYNATMAKVDSWDLTIAENNS